MSWLFGRKKYQKDSPASDFAEEEQSSDQSEGFVMVKKRPAPPLPNMDKNSSVYPSGNLYPYIPTGSNYSSTLPTTMSKEHSTGDDTHYLSRVPFKLSKQLENSISNDLDIDRLRIDEILSFLERIEKQNYDYTFSLEEGVVAEMNSGNGK